MTTLEFLSHLRTKDVKVWIDDNKLRFRAPERAMTPDLKAEMAARKGEILRFLRDLKDTSRAEMPPLRRARRDQSLPLSFSQERLWFLDQLFPHIPLYNLYGQTDFKKALNEDALQRAFSEVIRRHEVLRTTFQSVNGIPVQIIAPPSPFPLEIVDLRSLPAAAREAESERLASEDAGAPFDLAKGPLLRAKLLRLGNIHYRLLLSIHHIVMDDWSRKLFDQELDTVYTAFSQDLPSPLSELPVQYADFAVWQRDWMQGKVLESYVEYWAEQLKGDLPKLDFPTDRPRGHSCAGAEGRFALSRSLSLAIKAFSDREGVTPFMTLIAAYSALLSRYTGQEDIIVGSPIADRNQPETTQLIGFLLNTLVLRSNLSDNPTFRAFLKQVRDVCIGAQTHQEVPYQDLMHRLHVKRTLSGSPIFQTMIVLLNTPAITRDPKGLWAETEEHSPSATADQAASVGKPFRAQRSNGTAKFDLSFLLVEEKQAFHGIAEYNTDLFDYETIARVVERLQLVLHSITTNPEQRISELPLMTEAQQYELLAAWSGREEAFNAPPCLHQLFEIRAQQNPESVAVEFAGKSLSYAELNSRANQLARLLQTQGVGPEAMVGIFLERSPEMVIAMLGTLKAGAAYLPLDPSYPQSRLSFMLEDAPATVLLTQSALLASLPDRPASTICVDMEWDRIASQSREDLPSRTSEKSQVCVLYTSGSTGRPKGVMLTHEALVNYTLGGIRDYQFVPSDRVLQFSSVGFDGHIEEIYLSLVQGATLVLRPDHMLDSISTFLSCCREMKLTVLNLPTAYWHEIVSRLEVDEIAPTLRLVIIGGERALPEKFALWQKLVGDRPTLLNSYGPTEGTVVVTRCELRQVPAASGKEVPIGWPIANSKIYILDRWMQPAAEGIPAELYIGGVVLARGYLNRADLTAEKFLPDPFTGKPGGRLYRTGDLARFLPNGSLEYRGRHDHQTKIRGYRIEPGEIEAVLRQHEGVKDALVLAREDDPGLKRLVAYIVTREEAELTGSMLRGFLKPKLPEYMLPSIFVFLPHLPLNSNGKVDRQALPKPDRSRSDFKGDLVGPRTPTEESMASIWAEILKLDRISVHENFFELGGHSLLATQVISHIADTLHVNIPLRRLFELPTIAELCMEVERLAELGSTERPRIVSLRGSHNEPIPKKSNQAERLTTSSYGNSVPTADEQNIEQILAAVEGLSSQEISALLGEEEQVESADAATRATLPENNGPKKAMSVRD